MKHIKGILFDLDGVIIDSEPSYSEFWESVNQIYPTGVENFATVIKGNTLSKILSTYFDPETHDDITERLLAFEKTAPYPMFPNAITVLNRLKKSNNCKIALVTSSNNDKMANLYNQHPELKTIFDTTVTANDVSKSKPDPEGYLTAAKRLNIDAEETIVVEDSLSGIIAGKNAKAFVVGLTTTIDSSIVKAHSDITLENISQLPDYFELIETNFVCNEI